MNAGFCLDGLSWHHILISSSSHFILISPSSRPHLILISSSSHASLNHPHLIPHLILISSSSHPHLILISSSSHPHLILISSSSHPHLILISSSSHPHHILISSSSHPHLILISSSSYPRHLHIAENHRQKFTLYGWTLYKARKVVGNIIGLVLFHWNIILYARRACTMFIFPSLDITTVLATKTIDGLNALALSKMWLIYIALEINNRWDDVWWIFDVFIMASCLLCCKSDGNLTEYNTASFRIIIQAVFRHTSWDCKVQDWYIHLHCVLNKQ